MTYKNKEKKNVIYEDLDESFKNIVKNFKGRCETKLISNSSKVS